MMIPKRKLSLTASLALLVALSITIIFPLATHVATSASNPGTVGADPSGPQSGQVNVTQIISPGYSLFDVYVPETIDASLTFNSLNLRSSLDLQIASSFSAQNIIVIDKLTNDTSLSLTTTANSVKTGGLYEYHVVLPTSTEDVSITFQGSHTGESFLWRYITNIPVLIVSGLDVPISHTTFTDIPVGSIIWEAYGISTASRAGGQLPIPPQASQSTLPGYVTYQIPSKMGSLLVQSKFYQSISLIIIFWAGFTIILAGLDLLPGGKRVLSPFYKRISSILKSLTRKLGGLGSIGGRSNTSLRRRIFSRKRTTANDLLILFIACGILMVGIAVMAGPNPNVEAYVISNPTETHAIHQNLDAALGGNVIIVTPNQDYTDFGVMSSVGQFNVVVISSYPSVALPEVKPFIISNLANVPVIVIDNSTDPTFAAEIKDLYPSQVLVVGSAANLRPNESNALLSLVSASKPANPLGFTLSGRDFDYVNAVDGGLSFILILFGWAYLGAKAVESDSELSLTRIAFIIATGVFVFYFSEVVYVVTSTALEFPLSLHAVISGASDITSTGIFGHALHIPLGGGSTPRLLAGVVGMLFGSLWFSRGALFSKRSIALVLGAVVLVLANPLSLGTVVFQGILLFVGNIPLGAAYATALTFKGLLYGFGSAVGGSVTPVFLLSAGKIAFFAGIVPLAFLKKMGKTSATLTLLLSALLLGDGGVRVGEMTPSKTEITVIPGIMFGFAIALILLLIALFERYLTTNYGKTRR